MKSEIGGSVVQFITYIGNPKILEITDLEYWFDKNKKISSENIIKKEFKKMFYKNGLTTKGEEVFEVIWKNESLRESLFTDDNISEIKQFKNLLNSLSSNFYNFIKVK